MTNKEKRRNIGGGFGLPTLLTIIFIILRLTDVVEWKWLWVFSPIWISLSLGALFLIIIGFILLAAVIGIIGAGSAAVLGIKRWFGKTQQEEKIGEQDSNKPTNPKD